MRRAALMLCAIAALSISPVLTHAQATQHDATRGYVRLDTNLRDHVFWLGAGVPAGPVELHGDLVLQDRTLEADAGVAFYAGALAILPMLGLSFDFGDHRFDRLVLPRVFSVVEVGPLYVESWLMLTLRDLLEDGAADEFYTRDFLLFVFNEHLAVGPQVEVRAALRRARGAARERLLNLPVGGRISSAWDGHRFALFVGYEAAELARGNGSGFTGRFTYTLAWQ